MDAQRASPAPPRTVDTSGHYCPCKSCRYYGWVGLGNIRANGHPNGGRWRQLECIVCGKTLMETINTIFYGKKMPAETIWQALKALAEGLGIQSTARVFDVDANTVEGWLRQAAEHMEAVSHYLIHDLELTYAQVVKKRVKGRVVSVTHRCGHQWPLPARTKHLQPGFWTRFGPEPFQNARATLP